MKEKMTVSEICAALKAVTVDTKEEMAALAEAMHTAANTYVGQDGENRCYLQMASLNEGRSQMTRTGSSRTLGYLFANGLLEDTTLGDSIFIALKAVCGYAIHRAKGGGHEEGD